VCKGWLEMLNSGAVRVAQDQKQWCSARSARQYWDLVEIWEG